jgi:hypothetical protein
MNNGNMTQPSTHVAAKNRRSKNVVMAFIPIRLPRLPMNDTPDHRVRGARELVLDRNPKEENLNMSHSSARPDETGPEESPTVLRS